MVKKRFFEKHHSRLVTEGVLKAALIGLTVGLFANFLAALAAWFFDFGGIWFAIGVGVGSALITGVILYFTAFRPTTQQIARRVDRLGLEERMITMLELQGDDSYIAQLQRENAREHLKDVENRKLRIRLPRVALVLAAVALILGSGMTTVVALAEQEVIPPGNELINPEDPLANHIAVTYLVEEGGEIDGETDQLLLPGEDATPVVALAEDGWVFVSWDDGSERPDRHDLQITESVVYIAIFQEIVEDGEEGEGEEGEGGNGGQEGDQAEDLPAGGDASADSEQNGAGQDGDGQGSDGDKDSTGQGSSPEQGQGKGDGKGQGAGGKFQDHNQFIDGETYYGDHLDAYYEYAQQIFEENGEIPPELREFFENYFGGI